MAGGVVNGQSVDQVITNAAFLYKNANDSSTGVYTLAAPTSGPQINDVQNTINVIVNGLGGTQSAPATAYSSIPSNTIAQGDTANTALLKLARKFYALAASGGHTHDGTDGGGPRVAAVQSIAATGMAAVTGAVILAGDGQFITIGESGQTISIGFSNYGLSNALAVNNLATSGINFNGGAIAGLSYCDWNAVGFPSGYPAAGHVYLAASGDNHFYSKTSASATRRVDFTLAASGQTALYGDAILVAGSNVSLSQSGQQITIAAASGTAVTSFAASGQSSLNGAVTISAGTNITLTQAGQNVKIDASAGSIAVSEVTVDTGNGSGSTNTKVRRFTNIRKNVGSDISYADSATLGGTWTINTTGRYEISYNDQGTSVIVIGIVINGTALSTAINNPITYAQGLRSMAQSGANSIGFVSWEGNLSSGDIIYCQHNGNANYSDGTTMVTVSRVS